ncbi:MULTISPECIES: FGGY family carbohydrate kinase [unclassified Acidisoma]|jgi:xylulokinase|uniref:FGGY family carbohydrate kinase n=1 Tax=unclassified Acidisoma TaxID=2634065 RepID=UPI00131B465B|nr:MULTISPECIES: FGGY family carbohydrate kinase [unclassified Acidisoma]
MTVPDIVWCGIDLGSSNVKILFLAEDGRVVWRDSQPTPRVSDGIGPCADADILLDLVEKMMMRGHHGAALAQPLAAIAVGGTGEDGVPIDAEGRALDLAIPWFDRRADALARARAAERLWRDPRMPVTLDYSRTAAKWAWSRDHRPAPLAAAAGWLALTDYPAARWSGRPFMSESLAARTACYDIGARAWIEPLLEASGAPPLPPVLSGGTIVGAVQSARLLTAGVTDGDTVIVAGGHDHPLAAFAIRRQIPDAIIDSMGTAELLYGEVTGDRPPPAHPYFAFSRPIFGPGIACLGVMELSAVLRPLMEAEDETGTGFRDVMAGAPVPGRPGEGPLLRKLLENSAAMTRDRLRALYEMGVPRGAIFAAGGWAQSRSLLALRASVLGCPIHTVRETELSAYGAAVLAGVASGGSPPCDLIVETVEPYP